MKMLPTLSARHRAIVLAMVLAAVSGSLSAQGVTALQGHSSWNPIDAEVPALPPFCRADFRPKLYPGPGVGAYGCGATINHLCPGIVALNRALNPALPMNFRQGSLSAADEHLAYTRQNLKPSCRLADVLRIEEQRLKMAHVFVK